MCSLKVLRPSIILLFNVLVYGCVKIGTYEEVALSYTVSQIEQRLELPVSFSQSFTIYEDYMIGCGYDNETAYAVIIDLAKGELLDKLNLPTDNYHRPHANVCCFGKVKYSDSSITPLLYVSQWDDQYERGVLVYDFSYNN